MKRKIDTAIRLGKFKVPSKILEIGCLIGHYSFYMEQLGFSLTGTDLSQESVNTANEISKSIGSNVKFYTSDAEKLSEKFEENSFDNIFSFSVFRYFSDPLKAIKETLKVVKPGGSVVIDFPNINCPWFNKIKWFAPHIHDNLFTKKQIKGMFEKAGFNDVRAELTMFSHKAIPFFSIPGFVLTDAVLENIKFTSETAAIITCRGRKNAN